MEIMMSIKSPLDDEFDINDPRCDDEYSEVEIPDEPTLITIRDFALIGYKSIMDSMILVEPSSRAKYYQLAREYLAESKDAMHKIEKLHLEKKRMERGTNGKETTPSESTPKGTISRDSLYVVGDK